MVQLMNIILLCFTLPCVQAIKFFRNPLLFKNSGSQLQIRSNLTSEVPSVTMLEKHQTSSIVKDNDVVDALSYAALIATQTLTEIKSQGWSAIHESKLFSLFKRQKNSPLNSEGGGPTEYLMMGVYDNVSPTTLLKSQIEEPSRRLWDKSMLQMIGCEIFLDSVHCSPFNAQKLLTKTDDIVYGRSGWPWPLQDREYVLARKCKVFDKEGAVVLVSKSVESPKYPLKKECVRVDKYESRAVYLSTLPASIKDRLYRPGVKFVSIFCDDQKVAIPSSLMEVISKQAEKMVKGTMSQLHEVASNMQKNQVL